MNLLQAIDTRTSVRTYDGTELDAAARTEIEEVLSRAPAAPGGTEIRFAIVDPHPGEGGIKVGTYGVIRGAAAYIVPVAKASVDTERPGPLFDIGYVGEAVVLELTRLGYGTCWLGGTLRKDDFASAAGVQEGELIRAVIAIGRPADKRTFIETIIRGVSNNAVRLPSQVLFFDAGTQTPVDAPCERCADEAVVEPVYRILSAVRRAPSAGNKQPCRAIISKSAPGAGGEALQVDLFLMREERYNALTGYAFQTLDVGIAAAHLELAAAELGFGVERRAEPFGLPPSKFVSDAEFIAGWNIAKS